MTDPHDDLADRVAATRAQLFDTLDAIEDKLNVPKQIGIAASKVKRGIDEKPVPYLAGLAARGSGGRGYRRDGAPTAVDRPSAVHRVRGGHNPGNR
ncbi:hypothetical protein QP157_03320 [Sphingomonas sp. LR61]|uniref:hypothetical protein n=1 Tax=Sphingomonas sp. LR61 TaxID=3050234 RepID=UPI002FE0C810